MHNLKLFLLTKNINNIKVIFHFVKNISDKTMSRMISKKKERKKVFVKSIMAALILHTRTIERVMLIRSYCHVKDWRYEDIVIKCWRMMIKSKKREKFKLFSTQYFLSTIKLLGVYYHE